MTKLHAQMALLGSIDEVVRNSTNPETVATIEKFLPGTTGVGQQGWFRELKHFLNRPELKPLDENGIAVEDSEPVTFPDLGQALIEVGTEPLAEGDPASPGLVSRSIFASMILGIANEMEDGGLARVLNIEGFDADPLEMMLSTFTRDSSQSNSEGIEGLEPRDIELPVVEGLTNRLLRVRSRAEYLELTQGFARSDSIDPDLRIAMKRPPLCTGSLRRIDGQFCTVLTTDWETDFTLSQVQDVIHPENWPKLCTFFDSMAKQDPFNPDISRGWTRLLEGVSGDPTQWKMLTALRFWMARPDSGGVYLNYDLDNPRVGDGKLVEVDAGYLRAIPVDGSADPIVKIRTCKQVRIRGVSTTATAALACGFGWGDAMSDMFVDGVTKRPDPGDPDAARVPLTPSIDPGPPDPKDIEKVSNAAFQAAGNLVGPNAAILAAAKEVELIRGWRGAIIEAMSDQLGKGIDTARDLGTDFAVRWSDGDGLSLEDVKGFGAQAGEDITAFATGIFKEAAAALQPKYDDADADGGNY